MAVQKRGGYKVDMELLTLKAIDTTAYILSWSRLASESLDFKTTNVTISRPVRSAHTPSVKKKFMNNLRDTLWKMMDDSSRYSAHKHIKSKVSSHALSLNSKYDYMGELRAVVNKALQVKHSKLEKTITSLIGKFPNYQDELKELLTCRAEDTLSILRTIRSSLDKHDEDQRELHIALNKVNGMNEFIYLLRPTETDIGLRSEDMKLNRTKRKRSAKKINYSDIQEVIKEGLASEDFYNLAVAVAITTGRRFIEVIHTCNFNQSELGQGFFEVSGIAKKIDQAARTEVHTLPCNVKANLILQAVKKLRSHEIYQGWMQDLSTLDYKQLNKALNNRAARGASERFNQMMSCPPKTLVFKDTRSIAGLIAEKKLYPNKQELWEGFDTDEFKTYYLVHDNLEEAVNYGHIDLSFDSQHEIEKYLAPTPTIIRSKGVVVKGADVSALEKLKIVDDKHISRVHEHVIRVMTDTAFKLSASLIYKGKVIEGERIKFGGSMAVIKRYLADGRVRKALDVFYRSNEIK